jgi:hypothetical protein
MLGQNTGVIQQDKLTHVNAVFNQDRLLQIVKSDMLMVQFNPDLDEMTSLSNVNNLTKFTSV